VKSACKTQIERAMSRLRRTAFGLTPRSSLGREATGSNGLGLGGVQQQWVRKAASRNENARAIVVGSVDVGDILKKLYR